MASDPLQAVKSALQDGELFDDDSLWLCSDNAISQEDAPAQLRHAVLVVSTKQQRLTGVRIRQPSLRMIKRSIKAHATSQPGLVNRREFYELVAKLVELGAIRAQRRPLRRYGTACLAAGAGMLAAAAVAIRVVPALGATAVRAGVLGASAPAGAAVGALAMLARTHRKDRQEMRRLGLTPARRAHTQPPTQQAQQPLQQQKQECVEAAVKRAQAAEGQPAEVAAGQPDPKAEAPKQAAPAPPKAAVVPAQPPVLLEPAAEEGFLPALRKVFSSKKERARHGGGGASKQAASTAQEATRKIQAASAAAAAGDGAVAVVQLSAAPPPALVIATNPAAEGEIVPESPAGSVASSASRLVPEWVRSWSKKQGEAFSEAGSPRAGDGTSEQRTVGQWLRESMSFRRKHAAEDAAGPV